jgi:hypothetical protein
MVRDSEHEVSAEGIGDSVGPFDSFTVTIPPGFADGAYDGKLVVQGGAALDDSAVLGSGSFTVGVAVEGGPASRNPAHCSWWVGSSLGWAQSIVCADDA